MPRFRLFTSCLPAIGSPVCLPIRAFRAISSVAGATAPAFVEPARTNTRPRPVGARVAGATAPAFVEPKENAFQGCRPARVSRGRRLPPSLSVDRWDTVQGMSPELQTPAFVERDQRGRGAVLSWGASPGARAPAFVERSGLRRLLAVARCRRSVGSGLRLSELATT